MSNAAIIICTRPQSSRLPGKVFMPVAGVPAIEHILSRLQGCGLPVILAVPTGCTDYDSLIDKYRGANRTLQLSIYYGNPASPLHRMADCIEDTAIEWVIRITHDDILIDRETMLELYRACAVQPDCGYGVTPRIVDGAGVEVIHRANLLQAAKNRVETTEFISYFVKESPRREIKVIEPRESICRPYRLTMDYYDDWIVLDTVLTHLGPFATLDSVCHYLDTHPHVTAWNKQPLLTFYTCVRNGDRFIRQAMQSVLNNQGIDFEYIVVDDGSDDSTAIIVSEFSSDRRVRFFKNYHSIGLASSSNIAIDKARGKYIMRVDADDMLLPDAASKMIQKIESDGAGAVYSAYHETGIDSQIVFNRIDPRFVHHAGCALFDHKMINEIRFTEGLRHFDGADLHKRMQARNMPISYIDQPLWLYRRHDKNISDSDRLERDRVRGALGIGQATATSYAPGLFGI
jgi:spore coat polysaccharide biosynthesis protein SpsF (cytidylyltransferase family)